MKKVGLLAIMDRYFTSHHNEWNIACDLTAAKGASERAMNIFCTVWELTKEISIDKENYEYIYGNIPILNVRRSYRSFMQDGSVCLWQRTTTRSWTNL